MALYTIHLPGQSQDPEALERAVLLREGFSWPAFLFSGLWLLWNRLWLGFAGFVLLSLAISLLTLLLGLPRGTGTGLGLLLALAVGFEGLSQRRLKLEARGFRLAGIVSADTAEQAERKAFLELSSPASAPARPAAAPRLPDAGVIGLFPQPGTQR